ncbi:efflux RND transporter permease subunit [Pseudomonas corrugata]|uniref:efflux RND transporter permease subunit n=2 Tax=Pseudomonas corrugata TaxID=47879 RepID=UPI0015869FB3|nr:MMPL family transporter [Pseudomonas corrugata]NUT64691.1 MMPL family transporter [Pseudomonas corrugata]
MSIAGKTSQSMCVVADPRDFDANSGGALERLVFNYRLAIVAFCALMTLVFGLAASRLEVNAGFDKMIPQSHPFVRNYFANVDALRGISNTVRVVVENRKGDIYDPAYLLKLQQISDALFLMPGVDRSYMKSLWTPTVRWTEITEQGFSGGPVMPDDYDGTAASLERLKTNIQRSGIIGSLVASGQHSSMIVVPLLDVDPATGKPLDYGAFSKNLEAKVRGLESVDTGVYIVGFAKLIGDLIDGMQLVLVFFAVAAAIALAVIYLYTRCLRSALLLLLCSMAAVIWQLGIAQLCGFVLDPYSILVPFLVFAIGVSHGAQKMNGIMQDIGRGTHKYVAARYTFRRLFVAGLTALLADVVGFAVLMMIDIPVIRSLAMIASIGVGVLIFTNLLLLPVLLSYIGVSANAAQRSLVEDDCVERGRNFSAHLIALLERFTTRRWAVGALLVAAVLTTVGFAISLKLQVGDLDPGAPELRADSRYNRDNVYISQNYGLSSDQFAVIVRTPPGGTATFATLLEMDRLEQLLRALPGVQTTQSAASVLRMYTAGNFEGNPKWMTINRDPFVLGDAFTNVVISQPEFSNQERTVAPVLAFLKDHKAQTLTSAVDVVQAFAAEHDTDDRQFLLAAGSAGIEAATNIVVQKANREMLILVYLAVAALCFVTFRSWRAVLVAMIPLVMTSVLCEALMVMLGIGVKVATLPVIALGVGIGVDYALYLLSVQIARQRAGASLREAYRDALGFTGKVVGLVGLTLAAGVITWAWSPIKFQADMGILLTFMFLWNMIGAMVLIPALSHFLLPDSHRKEQVRGADEVSVQIGTDNTELRTSRVA